MDKKQLKELRTEYETLKYFKGMNIETYNKEKEGYDFHFRRIENEQREIRAILSDLTASESDTAKKYRDKFDNLENDRLRYAQLIESWERASASYKRFLFLKKEIDKYTELINEITEDNNKKPFVHSGKSGEQLSLF